MTEYCRRPADEIAGYLRVAEQSVYQWIDSNGLPAHRVGPLRKFKRSAVAARVTRGHPGSETRQSGSPFKGGRT